MSVELDALLIRSLPELNDAANRLYVLDQQIVAAVDGEIAAWAERNGWSYAAEFHDKDQTWLAPADWMVPDSPDEDAYLYFKLKEVGSSAYWYAVNYVLGAEQRLGFGLFSNTMTPSALNRLIRNTQGMSDLPMDGASFFLPLRIDRDELAAAIENEALTDGMSLIRQALDQLPTIVDKLCPLRAAMAG